LRSFARKPAGKRAVRLYEKGAFTGAYKEKEGFGGASKSRHALIDEVGRFNLSLQVKTLALPGDEQVPSLGGAQERQLDIRIMAATNRNLLEDVKKGRFREDLYYV